MVCRIDRERGSGRRRRTMRATLLVALLVLISDCAVRGDDASHLTRDYKTSSLASGYEESLLAILRESSPYNAAGDSVAALGGSCGNPSNSCRFTNSYDHYKSNSVSSNVRRNCPSSGYCYYGSEPIFGTYGPYGFMGWYGRCSREGFWYRGSCRDCQGSWTGYSQCTESTVCGDGLLKRTYYHSVSQGPRGSAACPYSNGYRQTSACHIECGAPIVSIGNAATDVASNVFDFGFKVNHQQLCAGDCLQSTSPNKDKVVCKVTVKKTDTVCAESDYGDYLPCKRFDNFKDTKIGTGMLLLTEDAKLELGEYQLNYTCSANFKSRGKDTSKQHSGSHIFNINRGCDGRMPISAPGTESVPNSELAKHLLLASDDFSRAPCDQLNDVKETIFRRFDLDPTDGVLTISELINAINVQGGDSYILKVWNATKSTDEIRLSLGHVMKVNVAPMHCVQPNGQSVTFENVVYPSVESGRETSRSQCAKDASKMAVVWKFGPKNSPKVGDTVCAFVDGILFRDHEPTTIKSDDESYTKIGEYYALTKVVDKRPVFGGFEDVQPSLVAQFSFDVTVDDRLTLLDDGTVISAATLASDQRTVPMMASVDGDSMKPFISGCHGGAGGMCVSPCLNGYKYKGDAFNGGLAFSTWIKIKASGDATVVQNSGSSGQYNNSLTIKVSCSAAECKLKAEYKSGLDTYPSGAPMEISFQKVSWQLIGFTISHNTGMKLFAYALNTAPSATNVASDLMWPKDTLQKMPEISLFKSQSTAAFQFDDVRFYTGTLDQEIFLSSHECGRRKYCADRARTKIGRAHV